VSFTTIVLEQVLKKGPKKGGKESNLEKGGIEEKDATTEKSGRGEEVAIRGATSEKTSRVAKGKGGQEEGESRTCVGQIVGVSRKTKQPPGRKDEKKKEKNWLRKRKETRSQAMVTPPARKN